MLNNNKNKENKEEKVRQILDIVKSKDNDKIIRQLRLLNKKKVKSR